MITYKEFIVTEHESVIDNMKSKKKIKNLNKENLLKVLDFANKLKRKYNININEKYTLDHN